MLSVIAKIAVLRSGPGMLGLVGRVDLSVSPEVARVKVAAQRML